jgi:TM2 domain-containing membrane protein YozV
MKTKGFTLFEIIIYIAISSFVFTSLIGFVWNVIEVQAKTDQAVNTLLEDIYLKRMQNL